MDDFLKLTGDQQRDKYVKKGLVKEIEIAANFVDSLAEVPYLGNIIKMWKVGVNVVDLFFIKKVLGFLDASKGYTEIEFNTFFEGMNSHQRDFLSEFLISSISQADHRDKVIILGYIYKYRVKNAIDQDMLFRLCSAINRCYPGDLKELLNHKERQVGTSYKADILFNAGLLSNKGYNGGNTITLPGAFGMIYQQNEIGEKLVDILEREHWFESKV